MGPQCLPQPLPPPRKPSLEYTTPHLCSANSLLYAQFRCQHKSRSPAPIECGCHLHGYQRAKCLFIPVAQECLENKSQTWLTLAVVLRVHSAYLGLRSRSLPSAVVLCLLSAQGIHGEGEHGSLPQSYSHTRQPTLHLQERPGHRLLILATSPGPVCMLQCSVLVK